MCRACLTLQKMDSLVRKRGSGAQRNGVLTCYGARVHVVLVLRSLAECKWLCDIINLGQNLDIIFSGFMALHKPRLLKRCYILMI